MGLLDTACFGNKACQQARDQELAMKQAQAAALAALNTTKPDTKISGPVIAVIVVVIIFVVAGIVLLVRKKKVN